MPPEDSLHASGSGSPTVPTAPPANPVYGLLRVLCFPAPAPAVLFIWSGFGLKPLAAFWTLVVLSLGIGVFDASLCSRLRRRTGKLISPAVAAHALTFTLLQAIIAPLVAVGILFGMCALS